MRVAACAGSVSDSDRAAFYCSGTDGGAESEAFCGKAAGRSLPYSGSRTARIVRGACLMAGAVSDDIDGGVFRSSERQEIDLGTDRRKVYFVILFDVSFRPCTRGKMSRKNII